MDRSGPKGLAPGIALLPLRLFLGVTFVALAPRKVLERGGEIYAVQ